MELIALTDECYLCLRVSAKTILESSHKLFPDSKLSHKIGMRTAELLREAYLKNPAALCGRSTSGLIAGAMYVACLLEKEWKSQRQIAEALKWEVTETTIRCNYQLLTKILGIEIDPTEYRGKCYLNYV